ncbi:phosphoglycerate dehydrogenase-like enzyme [Caldalkalibacillus uzonensis]|uniref:Phosphoglycerate dehydrogenase-like enzyme n=1 Tax=Caldalkalibacillus uzonensis TaxID=353224 RepID=A0ABU0CWN6_9BACI|nr:NAD(P)-dependent oxidoreductase [Caldalkalibacillus uzonensis]MDQ0340826.1 phosphoglycerate dehydrogenase-like enzyme [Caldalkalibacillus uzonensis]
MSAETKGLINKDALSQMKIHSDINKCGQRRGGIVVEEDLYYALTSGQILGAALDVNDNPKQKGLFP